MTNRTHSLRYTGSAIAAALVFASTSSLAQDAAVPFQPAPEPAIVIPEIPTAAPTTPTIVVPPVQAETVQPVPAPSVETPEPQAAPAVAPPARTRATTPAATPATRAAPATAPSVAAPEPAAAEPAAVLPPPSAAEPVDIAPGAPLPVNEPARAVANDDTGLLALTLGGLVFLALAIWGFVAIGRRKGIRRYAAETSAKPITVTPSPVVVEPVPVVAREPVTTREPVALASRNDTLLDGPSFTTRQSAGTTTSGALPHAGASVALPARVPQDYAERDALMKRMIAAKPDRANPFTDRGARTRRARLILQSLGRNFGDNQPWIDLSQYPNNWPELANKRSAAA